MAQYVKYRQLGYMPSDAVASTEKILKDMAQSEKCKGMACKKVKVNFKKNTESNKIAIGDPGCKQGTKKPSSNRIAIGDPGCKQGTKKPSSYKTTKGGEKMVKHEAAIREGGRTVGAGQKKMDARNKMDVELRKREAMEFRTKGEMPVEKRMDARERQGLAKVMGMEKRAENNQSEIQRKKALDAFQDAITNAVKSKKDIKKDFVKLNNEVKVKDKKKDKLIIVFGIRKAENNDGFVAKGVIKSKLFGFIDWDEEVETKLDKNGEVKEVDEP